LPFANAHQLRWHYERHKSKFAFPDENAYLAAAEAFMSGSATAPTKECFRSDGDRIRFNRFNGYFAVDDGQGTLRTFFKPEPNYIASGFFRWQCSKRTDEL